ncbi:MAG: kynureninase [Gemmatimonadota bacterium]|nr:kynureninase [Gemmatimonadota bacterium]
MESEQPTSASASFPTLVFESGEAFARARDAVDPLADFRSRFELPGAGPQGEDRVYLLGNSLGPLPRGARAEIAAELDAWAARGVESYFEPPRRWYEADERYRPAMAEVVGAHPDEVALAGSLTTNLHLLFASFYRPEGGRARILVEADAFPSDRYLVETQLAWHGIDPREGMIEVGRDDGTSTERPTAEGIEAILSERGDEIALVFLGGVNYLTGEALDVARITRAAHAAGCTVGFDLAHAAGNVPLRLHDDGADFAAWCSYKYLNSGPGSVAGLFVHRRHASDAEIPRLGGWWGVDPDTRFRMAAGAPFTPRSDAAGWQLSCPPILAMAPLGPALAMFEEAGMAALREKSVRLTGYLEWLLAEADDPERAPSAALTRLTPAEPERRGAQLSYRVPEARAVRDALSERGVDVDLRDPDVLRLAPCPLFNRYLDVYRAAHALLEILEEGVS